MVDKIKEDICELITNCSDYELLDEIWKTLCRRCIDRECSPYELMTDEELIKWQRLIVKSNSRKKR